ncbi:MAG: histone deacetylase [Deltaproteobacteria bacterium]|nr:histone deacetylase [Deltaproteobacteria bacterium]
MATGIIRDDRFLAHDMGAGHPESPDRLRDIHRELDRLNLMPRLTHLEARPAGEADIVRIHDPALYHRVEFLSSRGGGGLDGDTYAAPETFEVARLATGGLLHLVEAIATGTVQNGIALVRPPGHHAEPSRAMGFCFFNNVAVAADHALRQTEWKRVAIVDYDIHHGNGTQNAFYGKGEVLYISSHQYPYYPGTGHFRETGTGAGEGKTLNIPLPPGQGDAEFLYLYQRIVRPALEKFRPDLIIVSAGFDIYRLDPLGGMKVTEQGFAELSRLLVRAAGDLCGGRVLFALEGGYHTQGLAASVGKVVGELLGDPAQPVTDPETAAPGIREYTKELIHHFRPYWGALG